MHQTREPQNTWAKTKKAENGNRQFHNHGWRLWSPRQQLTEPLDTNQKGYRRSEQQSRPTGSDQYVQNTPPNKSMTRVFLKPMELSTR